jgi:arginyl-tRNA synthetase
MLIELKARIGDCLNRTFAVERGPDLELREVPERTPGDVSLSAHAWAKALGTAPNAMAIRIGDALKDLQGIVRCDVAGAYVNLHLDRAELASALCRAVDNGSFFVIGAGEGRTALLEHTSINPNASPHVGRGRNAIIGDALARLARALGYSVEVHYYINDMGKQIALLVLASREKPSLKFEDLLDLYVAISKRAAEEPRTEQDAFALLDDFEKGNAAVRAEFRRVVDLCVEGQTRILRRIGVEYDCFDRESDFLDAPALTPLIDELERKDALFIDEHGRQVIDLEKLGFTKPEGRFAVVRRANGTSMYVLRDLAYTMHKAELTPALNLSVLGEDHRLYQEQLNTILTSAGIAVPETIYYSFVILQQGKMSTRQGNVVLLSDLIDQTSDRAAVRVRDANAALDGQGAGEIAAQIAVGAIRYGILSVSPSKNVTFDLERALQFEGNTGPYIQYSCTRLTSILQKTDAGPAGSAVGWDDLHEAEWALVLSLARYPEALMNSWANRNPATLCSYLYSVAKACSRFYHDCPVLTAGDALKDRRLALCRAAHAVLLEGLKVLGIEAPEKM